MITNHTLDNGLRVAVEPQKNASSVSLNLLIPGGCAHDDDRNDGCAVLLHEMLLRGTKSLSSRNLSDSLDAAGMQRGGAAGRRMMRMSATTTHDKIAEAIPLLFDMVISPRLDAEELPHARALALQSLAHLTDDPEEEATLTTLFRHLFRPFHRTCLGSASGLEATDVSALQLRHQDTIRPDGAILAIAGRCEPDDIIQITELATHGWVGACNPPTPIEPGPRGKVLTIRPTSQVHLAMAWDAPQANDEDCLGYRLLMTALGGTTSGRLFTEIRQRRSLCYAIGTSTTSTRDAGWCLLRAGTTPQHAHTLVETACEEVSRIAQDLTDEEFERARRSTMSALVLQGESTRARARHIAADLYDRGTCRTLEDRLNELQSLDLEAVKAAGAAWPLENATMVAIGPEDSLPWDVLDPLRTSEGHD